MKSLDRKLLRELRRTPGLLLAIASIITIGVMMFVYMRSTFYNLNTAKSQYYAQGRMADFWIDVKKAPLTAVRRVGELPGVAAIEPRVVFDVILDLPEVVRPLTGRLISMPADGWERTINGICLVRGSGFSHDRNEEVILGEEFAKEHQLSPGDRVDMILGGKHESFVIVGTAISPESLEIVIIAKKF